MVRPRAPAPTWTCSHASAPSRFLPSWESEPRSPQALLWHKACACLLPKPKVNLPKPLVLLPTGQAWLQAGGIGSSRDIRTLGPAAGIPGDSQSLAPQNSWLRHEHLGAETDLPQHGDWKLPHESLPALVKCGLTFAAPSTGWAWQQAATGTGCAGRVAEEGGDRGIHGVTQQEHFNDRSSSCKTLLPQHCPVLHQHPGDLAQKSSCSWTEPTRTPGREGEQCGTAPVPPCKLLKGPCLLGCIGRQLTGEWQ